MKLFQIVHLPTDALDDIGMEGIRRHANHQREVGRGVLIETILKHFELLLAERDDADNDYPAMLRLEMERRDMLLVAEELIRMARSTEERWQFVFHGTLSEVPPE